jgi:hypothetical protein
MRRLVCPAATHLAPLPTQPQVVLVGAVEMLSGLETMMVALVRG